MKKEKLELYVHIPFCVRKCGYCDFLSFPSDEETRGMYVEKLIEEIRCQGAAFSEYQVPTVFIGGGTPSILEAGQTERIMEALGECFDLEERPEITMEANPGTLDKGKLDVYKKAGINRISLGLQSTMDRELVLLGRIHTYGHFLESFILAREAGFTNLNVDLMSALPGQTVSSWERTLSQVAKLEPEHISAYSLIVEEGTPFYEKYGGTFRPEDRPASSCFGQLPPEEEERDMYHMTGTFLKSCGYERYEISNYARPGYECRHNIGYWDGTAYLGLGLGSSSYVGGQRFANESDLSAYLKMLPSDFISDQSRKDRQVLSSRERMEEFMFLGLRLTRGISVREFERRFGTPAEEIYGSVLKNMEKQGLMERTGDFWRLTGFGIDVSNYVLSEFLLD